MTENFKEKCSQPAYRDRLGKIEYGDNQIISSSDYLSKIIVDDACITNRTIIGSIYAKSINFETLYDYELSEQEINVLIGVKYADNSTEYINLGKYTINNENSLKTAKNGQYSGIDILSKLDTPYICGIIDFTNVTIKDFLIDLCNQLDITLGTENFTNDNLPVSGNPFTNNETCRTVLKAILNCSLTFATIDVDNDTLILKWLDNEVSETFTKNDYDSLEKNGTYDIINCLIIRDPVVSGENVIRQDTESIAQNGEHQFIIEDTYFLYTEELRNQAIDNIWNKVKELTYIDCKLTTSLGKPYLKVGQKISIEDNDGNYFETYILKHQFTYDGTFHSVIESPALTKDQEQNKNTTDIRTRVKNTERSVDKINGKIEDIIEDVDGNTNSITQLQMQQGQINLKVENNTTEIGTLTNKTETLTTGLNSLTSEVQGQKADFEDFKDNEYAQSISNLQDQIDGAIQFWNGPVVPTINNYPANEWTTENDRINHTADIYTVIEDVDGELKQGKAYRFDKVNGTWQWIELTDNELSAVQAIAQAAKKESEQNTKDIELLQSETAELNINLDNITSRVSSTESSIEEIVTTTQTSTGGNDLYLEKAIEKDILEYHVDGKTEQDTHEGKNYICISEDNHISTNTNISECNFIEENGVSLKGTVSYDWISTTYSIDSSFIKRNTKYTLAYKVTNMVNMTKGLINFNIYSGTTRYWYTNLYCSVLNEYVYITFTTPDEDLSNYSFRIICYLTTSSSNYTSGATGEIIYEDVYLAEESSFSGFEKYVGGTPSPNPDYPQELKNIEGVRNLFDKENANILNDIYVDVTVKTIKSVAGGKTIYIPIESNTTYTVQKISSARFNIGTCVDTPALNVSLTNVLEKSTATSASITSGANDKYLCVFYYFSTYDTSITEQEILDSIQLEKGTKAHPYVPNGGVYKKIKVQNKNLLNINGVDVVKNENTYSISGNASSGKRVFENQTFKSGEYKLCLKLFKQSNTDTTLSTYINDTSASNYTFAHINNANHYNLNQIYTRTINMSEDFNLKSVMWGNANGEEVEFQMWLIRADETNISYIEHQEKEVLINLEKPNLFDEQAFVNDSSNNGYYSCNQDTGITVIKADGRAWDNIEYNISVESNKAYLFKLDDWTNVGRIQVAYYKENEVYISSQDTTTGIINTPANCVYLKTKIHMNTYNNSVGHVKLYEGYEDNYKLCSIGDTKDTLDIVNGQTVINKKIERIVLTGNETIYSNINSNWAQNTHVFAIYIDEPNGIETNGQTTNVGEVLKSSHFICKNTGDLVHYPVDSISYYPGSSKLLRIMFNIQSCSTATEFKTFLQTQYNNGTPVEVEYILETPKTITLDNTNIELYDGVNHVSFIDDLETNTSITYLRETPISSQYALNQDLNKTNNNLSETNTQLGQAQSDINATNTNLNNNYYNKSQIDSIETTTTENITEIKKSVETLTTSTSSQISVIQEQISQGVSKVTTTSGTFDENGLTIEKSGQPMSSKLDWESFEVTKDKGKSTEKKMLIVNPDRIEGENFVVRTYFTQRPIRREQCVSISDGSSVGIGDFYIGV